MPANLSAAPAPTPLPTTLEGYRNHHAGETIVVCGCGSSLASLADPEQFVTIGVNDVGRLFQPDYLVVLNPRSQFRGDRFHYVEHSQAKALFTHLNLGIKHPHIVRFNLGQRGGVDLSNPRALNYSRNSPYVAVCLALHMGAKHIGLIGVDFTEHHFFAKTGVHPLAGEVRQIDAEYNRLYQAARGLGVEMYNLSAESRLTALPKIGLAEFSVRAKSREALRIVSYTTTPVAGVPVVLGRSIAARTPHHGETVWASNDYGNGVHFAGGVQWRSQPDAASALIEAADVLIMHNGKLDPHHRSLVAGRPVVTMAHNYLWNVDQSFVRQGYPGLVVAQYQAALPEFARWTPIPNPVPLWEPEYQPGPKGERVTICYTPSGKHDSYPKSHRLYWHSKGYGPTMRLLDRLAQRFPLQLEVIRNQQISHAQSLAMKQRAHIVIDECVTGSYHRNSLEGLAAGTVVVNGFGLLPEVVDVVQRCLPEPADIPFVRASLDTLEKVLIDLIEQGPERLAEAGRTNRLWMERYWDFSHQWERLWMPAIERARERAGVSGRRPPRPIRMAPTKQEPSALPAQAAPAAPKPVSHEAAYTVSVIVPHGGAMRYRLLEATLRQLDRSTLAPEIILVEMDRELRADAIAREFAHRHVFVQSEEPFQLARARNVGIPFARGEYVLWLDSDLLMPPDFLGSAVEEISSRGLDCLIPWTAISYLSEEDSNGVIDAARSPQDCNPVNTFLSRRGVVGGAIMARKDFLLRFGGFDPGFRGWGGEDNGWLHKAQVLGRASVTNRQGQMLYHMFHEDSGGYGSRVQFSQPDYQRNVALLHRIRTIRTPSRFLQQFPPPAPFHAALARYAAGRLHAGGGKDWSGAQGALRRRRGRYRAE
jgi:glycosyl transferase family 2